MKFLTKCHCEEPRRRSNPCQMGGLLHFVRNDRRRSRNDTGMSLLEILVVVSVFAILGIIVTQSVILTLRGSKKSESQVRVRENVNYALSVIERQLRNSDSITACPNPDSARIDYSDSLGNAASFSCGDTFVASGSARLTGSEIEITTCSFVCEQGSSTNPPSVTVSLDAKEASAIGIEGAQVSSSTKVYLRTY